MSFVPPETEGNSTSVYENVESSTEESDEGQNEITLAIYSVLAPASFVLVILILLMFFIAHILRSGYSLTNMSGNV
ncbi:hypothetical protein MAR_009467 [Mya arenaria]|uniref:Uncharacterized protein n=1 Tax=Mya arenaria TaxID=6604 RepID=A0ABY7E148_MYAAR|nr:hypothetical protein MAR_009467 [Mya arenaria]